MFTRTKLSASLLVAFGGALASTLAAAQQQQLERVEITGSSIRRIEAEGALPVTVIKVEDLTRQGVTTAEQAMQRIAANQSNFGVNAGVGATTGGKSEADLRGHLAGEPVPVKRANAPVIKPAAGTKYDDFQLAYALDLLRGKMTVATVTTPPAKTANAGATLAMPSP